ncbi:MAG TPA: hypothetical protein VMV75_05655 [Sulfuricella sp.]|nr:hypothetical protein [Sulfuricella sp.]
MSISSVSSTTSLQPNQIADIFKQRKQDFTTLANALQSGDLAGAQKAFASMQQDSQTISQARGGQGSDRDGNNDGSKAVQAGQSSQSGKTGMRDLMNQLQQALSSGDLQSAQQAFASVQQSMQANQGQGHHHHHHGGSSQPNAFGTTSAGSSSSSAAQTTGINTTA